jgi:hypothetical protein
VGAIRHHDPHHLVTIGFLPTSVPLDGPARQYSGFAPDRLAPLLDFVSIHLYPQRVAPPAELLQANLTQHELILLALLASTAGKPVEVEEWFAYGAALQRGNITWGAWFDSFLAMTKPLASGWFSFYHAVLNDGAGAAIPDAYREWLDRFRAVGRAREAGSFPGPHLPTGDGAAKLTLDRSALLTSGAARAEALRAYADLRSRSKQPPRVQWAGEQSTVSTTSDNGDGRVT